jgi:MFS family permease
MQDTNIKQPSGMTGFTIIWIGQIVSVLASTMSQFGLTIWMYDQTKSATAMAAMQVCFTAAMLIVSPLAGVMVDRQNRKLMMMISDLAAGLGTISILVLQYLGILEFWHLYFVSVIFGLGLAFQWPAYSAAISSMVPKEQLGRVNGMMSLIEAGPQLISPLLAGALLPLIGLTGILTIDVITFVFAIIALALVFIPQPVRTEEGKKGEGGFLKEAAYGFKYIFERPGLLGLQTVFLFGNLFAGIGFVLVAPMILARTNSDAVVYGAVQTAAAAGAIIGGIVMSLWGGFKKRVHGVLLGWAIGGLFSILIGLDGSMYYWMAGNALLMLTFPLVNGSNQAIWQSKVAPDVQGRVFTSRRLIAWITQPIAPLIGGYLADYIAEPAMQTTSFLSSTFGWLVGTGAGSGMGLIIIFSSIAFTLVGLAGYLFPAIRDVEEVLPDHDTLKPAEAPALA